MTLLDNLTLMCAGITFFASFCRLTKTTEETFTTVRLGVVLIASASIFALAAPYLWHWNPDLIHLAVFFGLAVHQVATRKSWQHGVPHWFQYEK